MAATTSKTRKPLPRRRFVVMLLSIGGDVFEVKCPPPPPVDDEAIRAYRLEARDGAIIDVIEGLLGEARCSCPHFGRCPGWQCRHVRALRKQPGAYGLVGANGGFLSKYSVGVYSTRASDWRGFDSSQLQAEIGSWPAPTLAPDYAGEASVETYTIDYGREAPHGVVVCRTPTGERFVAAVEVPGLVQQMIDDDPLGAAVACERDEKGRRVATRLG